MIKSNNNFVAFNKHICRTAVLFLYSFDQGMLNRDWSSESSLNALWKENYSSAISFIHGCGGDGKGKQMIGCVGNKGKCWQGGETVKKCHKHQMYLPKLFNVQGKAGKWKERQEKCDKTKKCSQVRWKWYKNYALCTPHDYCSFHLKVNRLTHVTWRHMFSYFSLLCLAS